jgi:O-antigen/teichoic acid export membrane protein
MQERIDNNIVGKKITTLSQVASKSAFWSIFGALVRGMAGFFSIPILARLLTPQDFGVLAMAVWISGIVNLFAKFGLGEALIQKKEINQEYLSTAFWVNVSSGFVLALGFLILAPVASVFFKTPEVRPVMMVMSLNIVLISLGSIHLTLLKKNLKFKIISWVEMFATLVRIAIVLILAFKGYGVWSIVFGMMAERLTLLLLWWGIARWRPIVYFSFSHFKKLFHFGKNLYGENFLNFFNANSDYLMAGRFFGAAELGFYNFAYSVPHLVLTYLSQTVTRILFPIFSQVQDENMRLRNGYIKTLTFISLISFPVLFGLMAVAPEFVRVFYGEKWTPVILPLQILCVCGMLKSIFHTMGSILNAKGRPDIGFKWNAVMLPITLGSLFIARSWGIVGIAVAMTLLAFLSFIPIKYFVIQLIDLKFSVFLKSLCPALSGALLMYLGISGIKHFLLHSLDFSELVNLGILLFIGILIYSLCIRLMWRNEFNDAKQFVVKMIK